MHSSAMIRATPKYSTAITKGRPAVLLLLMGLYDPCMIVSSDAALASTPSHFFTAHLVRRLGPLASDALSKDYAIACALSRRRVFEEGIEWKDEQIWVLKGQDFCKPCDLRLHKHPINTMG